MTRTRLILLIRCVTLLGVGALLLDAGWLFAGASLVLVGLMMPVFAAATPCTAQCNSGTQGITNIQVDVTGVTNGICTDCANWNTSFLVPFVVTCSYSTSGGLITLCGTPNTGSLTFVWTATGGDIITLGDGGGALPVKWATPTVSSPRDCQDGSGMIGLTPPYTTGSSLRCNYAAASVTITPLP